MCREVFPATLEFFARSSRSHWGIRAYCRPCGRDYTRTWSAEHPNQKRATDIEWQKSHPENRSLSQRKFRRHSEANNTRNADWCKLHRPERAATQSNRRARKRGSLGTHTVADVRAQYARQKGRCFYGRKINPDCAVTLKGGYHVDHVTPLVKQGSNGTENIVLTCASCNLRKGAKHPMDFAGVLC